MWPRFFPTNSISILANPQVCSLVRCRHLEYQDHLALVIQTHVILLGKGETTTAMNTETDSLEYLPMVVMLSIAMRNKVTKPILQTATHRSCINQALCLKMKQALDAVCYWYV